MTQRKSLAIGQDPDLQPVANNEQVALALSMAEEAEPPDGNSDTDTSGDS